MAGIKLRPLVCIALAGLAALPWTRPVGMVLLSLAAHEWAHLFVARWCGAKTAPVRLGPFGMSARVRGMDNLHPRVRLCIYAAGPVFNIAIAWWAYTVHYFSYIGVFWLRDLAFYNAVLAAFNLLPLLPLDGGRIIQHYLGNFLGILRANRFLLCFGRGVSVVLGVVGFFQILLFSYNITLLCAAIFLWRKNTALAPALRLEALLTLQKKPRVLPGERRKKKVKLKTLAVPPDMSVSRALGRLGWSYFRVFYIKSTHGEAFLHEEDLLQRLFTYPACATLGEIAHSPATEPML